MTTRIGGFADQIEKLIEQRIAAAVAAETERCAKIVETGGGEPTQELLQMAIQYGANVALAWLIRKGAP